MNDASTIHRKPIGTRIRLARNSIGYSQDYVAKKLNITQQAYRLLETDDNKKITWERIEQIASICEIGIDELLSIDKNPIFNRDVKDCKQVGNQQAIYHEQNFERERLIYEQLISELRQQVQYWKNLFENILNHSPLAQTKETP